MHKILYKGAWLGGCAMGVFLLFSSCSRDKKGPGYEYMPNMYRSPGYETYSENPLMSNGASALAPVKGTIAQGQAIPYAFPNTLEGYERAGLELKNPIPATPENVDEGKQLFVAFCSHCHGSGGSGDGAMVTNEKFPAPPSFQTQLKELPEGKAFHSITYGKNMMGAHASQLTTEERWKIVHYIKKLQSL